MKIVKIQVLQELVKWGTGIENNFFLLKPKTPYPSIRREFVISLIPGYTIHLAQKLVKFRTGIKTENSPIHFLFLNFHRAGAIALSPFSIVTCQGDKNSVTNEQHDVTSRITK